MPIQYIYPDNMQGTFDNYLDLNFNQNATFADVYNYSGNISPIEYNISGQIPISGINFIKEGIDLNDQTAISYKQFSSQSGYFKTIRPTIGISGFLEVQPQSIKKRYLIGADFERTALSDDISLYFYSTINTNLSIIPGQSYGNRYHYGSGCITYNGFEAINFDSTSGLINFYTGSEHYYVYTVSQFNLYNKRINSPIHELTNLSGSDRILLFYANNTNASWCYAQNNDDTEVDIFGYNRLDYFNLHYSGINPKYALLEFDYYDISGSELDSYEDRFFQDYTLIIQTYWNDPYTFNLNENRFKIYGYEIIVSGEKYPEANTFNMVMNPDFQVQYIQPDQLKGFYTPYIDLQFYNGSGDKVIGSTNSKTYTQSGILQLPQLDRSIFNENFDDVTNDFDLAAQSLNQGEELFQPIYGANGSKYSGIIELTNFNIGYDPSYFKQDSETLYNPNLQGVTIHTTSGIFIYPNKSVLHLDKSDYYLQNANFIHTSGDFGIQISYSGSLDIIPEYVEKRYVIGNNLTNESRYIWPQEIFEDSMPGRYYTSGCICINDLQIARLDPSGYLPQITPIHFNNSAPPSGPYNTWTSTSGGYTLNINHYRETALLEIDNISLLSTLACLTKSWDSIDCFGNDYDFYSGLIYLNSGTIPRASHYLLSYKYYGCSRYIPNDNHTFKETAKFSRPRGEGGRWNQLYSSNIIVSGLDYNTNQWKHINLSMNPTFSGSNNVDLITIGHEATNTGIDLSISGNSTPYSGFIDLYLKSVVDSNINMFIKGAGNLPTASTKTLNLFLKGKESGNANNNLPLYTVSTGDINDYINLYLLGGGHGDTSGSLNMSITGDGGTVNDSFDLILKNPEPISTLSGTVDPTYTIPFWTQAVDTDTDDINLITFGGGLGEETASFPLFIEEGHISGALNLFMGRYWSEAYRSFTMYMDSTDNSSGISGLNNTTNFTMFMESLVPSISGVYINMYQFGRETLSEDLNLYLLPGLHKSFDLHIHGRDTYTDSFNMIVDQAIEHSGDLESYIRGGMARDVNLFINAGDFTKSSGNFPLSIHSTSNSGVFGTFEFTVSGDRAVSSELNLHIGGAANADFSSSYYNMSTRGIGTPINGSFDFAIINDVGSSSSGLNLFIPTRSGDEGVIPASGFMNLYINRSAESLSAMSPMTLLGPSGINNAIDMYLEGTPNERESLHFSISGLESNNNTVKLYINGY